MKKHIFITGGSGFIGSRLCAILLEQGHEVTVLSRQAENLRNRWHGKITVISAIAELLDYPAPNWIINLAGEPILDRPWTKRRRALLTNSRIDFTQSLFDTLQQLSTQPEVIISGSAIGFYGETANDVITESSRQGQGFSAELCNNWEQVALTQKQSSSRLCILRTGVVLGSNGGMLKKIELPFKLGLGGKLGNGQQWFSWVALEDICRLIIFLAENKHCEGTYNATSPTPVTNFAFTKAFGKHLKRPTVLPMPAFVLKTALGEAAGLLLDSQRVLPKRAIEAGFTFEHPDIESCLVNYFTK
ncbi:MAG: hypothetical protein ACI9QV_001425 [Methylophagaceae bacterium]|jgi:uncharacterized protein (TIGR01777 family)